VAAPARFAISETGVLHNK